MDKEEGIIQLTLAVFNDRRAEIRDRLGYRDQWLARYVFGVIAFLGASLGLKDIEPDTRILLSLVMPVMSLIVSLNVSAHVREVEQCANYLRGTMNDFLLERKIWAPHWDWQTSQYRHMTDNAAVQSKEFQRTAKRRWTNAFSLHLPSLVSLGVAAIFLTRSYEFCWCFSVPPVAPVLFTFASITVVSAMWVTWTSFDERLKHTVLAHTPDDWHLPKQPPEIDSTPRRTQTKPRKSRMK